MKNLGFLRSFIVLGALTAGLATAGTIVPVDFQNAETPPSATTVALPYFLSLGNDTVFLRFKIPDIASVQSIDAIDISVTLFDDGDRGGESGDIQFALPSANLELGSFSDALNLTTQPAPLTLSYSLDPSQIAQVFPSIEDGNLRIKVLRDTGDFYVANATVTMDGTFIPEPASILSGATGLLLFVGFLHRRRSR